MYVSAMVVSSMAPYTTQQAIEQRQLEGGAASALDPAEAVLVVSNLMLPDRR